MLQLKYLVIVFVISFVVIYWFLHKNKEGFTSFKSLFNDVPYLNRQVFSLNQRIDNVPTCEFLDQFKNSREVTCVGNKMIMPDSLRLLTNCYFPARNDELQTDHGHNIS